ncbi:hypothetical protein IV60_GL000209 [Lancefieldella rimae]|uniref:Uncharacterized protein n=2 Tax=Lancefieldella rimae TaxID=1383 RepID=B9CKS5_LANR4|nr:hypothetical protein ATORI0001_0634 [Lancefieldella rimae ATCC 49626]KRO03033.1 hypothetical protein IV60_GL000209 [Lancefieldella rimae]
MTIVAKIEGFIPRSSRLQFGMQEFLGFNAQNFKVDFSVICMNCKSAGSCFALVVLFI